MMEKTVWTRDQKHLAAASYLGWTLDAFDFFIMVFVLKDIAHEFGTSIGKVSIAIWLTLAMRPLGALIFGRIADHFGRRPAMISNILIFSALEFLTAFSPNLIVLLILRALFGIAMGGEWGIGSALTMESIPKRARGVISALLQSGYPSGYLLASVVFLLFYTLVGWRGMFMIGVTPALLVWYIRRRVPESPEWTIAQTKPKTRLIIVLKREWKLAIYAIMLMTAFNFFSHGAQDIYPTFLQVQHHFTPHQVGTIAVIYNIGAILGGFFFGTLSQSIGRRKAIAIAAVLALPIIPLWAFSQSPATLALGAFLIQFAVQGAWGVIPVHLNEISPKEVRATFPGLVYQLGNFFASCNATLQVYIAEQLGGHFNYGLAIIVATVSIIITILILTGPERHGISMEI